MQLHLHIQLNEPITLPVNYNHILQGVIYNAVFADYPNYADALHDGGNQFEERTYKAFTFGPLLGRYRIENKQIIFLEDITWEIRSSDAMLITILRLYFESHGMLLSTHRIRNVETAVTNFVVNDSKVKIKCISPVIAYSTIEGNSYTYYYTPEEYGFYELTKQNALRRYAAIKSETAGELEFRPVSVRRSDKVVTRYHGIIMSGWKGKYELEGDPELLDFLYQTGLGSKNAQGFGMFDILKPFD